VNCILQDSQGFLWFCTQDGLNRYDGYGFKVYKNDPDDLQSLSNDWITSIVEDADGTFWIGTLGGGLNKFDRDTEQFTRYINNPEKPNSLSHDVISDIMIDPEGAIWVATTGGGLNQFDRDSGSFTSYMNDADDPDSITTNGLRIHTALVVTTSILFSKIRKESYGLAPWVLGSIDSNAIQHASIS